MVVCYPGYFDIFECFPAFAALVCRMALGNRLGEQVCRIAALGEQLWKTLLGHSFGDQRWGSALGSNFGEQFSVATLSSFGELLSGALLETVLGTSFGPLEGSSGADSGTSFGEQISGTALGSSFR